MNLRRFIYWLLPLAWAAQASGQETDAREAAPPERAVDEVIYITGGRDGLNRQAGSAYILDENDLDRYKHTDIHRILDSIPGVYLQDEDGFGLRPNIGLRGAHPHRSKKVTLMEDGILVGPAPYSAPAAYYYPLPTRAFSVEVFKGPAAIPYGPNNVGGAINMVTRPVPPDQEAVIHAAAGSYGLKKLHGWIGGRGEKFGWLLEGASVQTDGFKKLPNPSDDHTGFAKHDLLGKLSWTPDPDQQLLLKFSGAGETSSETYLGLSESDFDTDPLQRYPASEKDEMIWQSRQVSLTYSRERDQGSLRVQAYYHEFHRDWTKVNGFYDRGIAIRDVLADPTGQNLQYYAVLRGDEDSLSTADQLILGSNDRAYRSAGVQLSADQDLTDDFMGAAWHLTGGLRLHRDRIERRHTEDTWLMITGGLQPAPGFATETATANKDVSEALAAWTQVHAEFAGGVVIIPGLRFEAVETTRRNFADGSTTDNSDRILAPGIGSLWHVDPNFTLLAGVYQGFTLVGPGQDDDIEPEKSLNYELGMRSMPWRSTRFELIGFYNDYSNLKSTCSFSTGCGVADLDREFNGGKARIYGVESIFSTVFHPGPVRIPLEVNGTITRAAFNSAFSSDNPDWGTGDINSGDPLPYIPEYKTTVSSGAGAGDWTWNLRLSHQSRVYDQAIPAGRRTLPARNVIDSSVVWEWQPGRQVWVEADNLTDERYAASMRPFGLRPGKPRSYTAGIKATF